MQETTTTVLSEIAEQIKTSAPQVKELLVKSLVDKEISDRVSLLEKALTKREDLSKSLKKMKPDVEHYKEDGEKILVWSKDKNEEKKKLTENLDKLDKAFEACFVVGTKQEFDKLRELVGK